jgi:hypothetical protein
MQNTLKYAFEYSELFIFQWRNSFMNMEINFSSSSKSLRIYAIYKLMLCITGIQSSTDII